jgi:hypothetical protein
MVSIRDALHQGADFTRLESKLDALMTKELSKEQKEAISRLTQAYNERKTFGFGNVILAIENLKAQDAAPELIDPLCNELDFQRKHSKPDLNKMYRAIHAIDDSAEAELMRSIFQERFPKEGSLDGLIHEKLQIHVVMARHSTEAGDIRLSQTSLVKTLKMLDGPDSFRDAIDLIESFKKLGTNNTVGDAPWSSLIGGAAGGLLSIAGNWGAFGNFMPNRENEHLPNGKLRPAGVREQRFSKMNFFTFGGQAAAGAVIGSAVGRELPNWFGNKECMKILSGS